MKTCPYCGKEYPGDVARCFTDGYFLPDPVSDMPSSTDHPGVPNPDGSSSEPKQKHQPTVTYPDYRWAARDAWKCVGMLVVFGFVSHVAILALDRHSPAFHGWRKTGLGYFCEGLLHYVLYLLTAAYCARTETFASFAHGFGLDRKPSERAWFGIAMALIIRGFGHLIISNRLSKGVSNYDVTAFRNTMGIDRYLFLIPLLLLAPLFEETLLRGFLYRAFRNSYRIWASMALIVALTAESHWRYYSRSWAAAVDLSLLAIVQCYLREKSDSTWDCILCHFVYNLSLLFVGHVFR